MSVVKYPRRPEITGVANLRVEKLQKLLSYRIIGYQGMFGSFEDTNSVKLRILLDGNVSKIVCHCPITVMGDVKCVNTKNTLNVEGTVYSYSNSSNTLYKNNLFKVNLHKPFYTYNPQCKGLELPTRVLHLTGQLINLTVDDLGDIVSEIVVTGDILERLESSDIVLVKGNISIASASIIQAKNFGRR